MSIVTAPSKTRRLYGTGASVGNGADTTDDVLQTFTLPAGLLANVGDAIHVVAGGTLAATTDNKTVRIRFGGTVIGSPSGSAATNTFWYADVWVIKTGANTQSYVVNGVLKAATGNPSTGTTAITDTNAIVVQVSGINATTSSAGSITCQLFMVDFVRP